MAYEPLPFTNAGRLCQTGLTAVPVSFETGEQNTALLFFPQPVKVTFVYGQVTKPLADTDAGTVLVRANGTIVGTLTFAASAALNNYQFLVPSSQPKVSAPDGFSFAAAKTTAGGRATIYVQWEAAP